MKKTFLGIITLLVTACAAPAHAQSPRTSLLGLELRGGLAYPMGDLSRSAIEHGTTLGANATVNVTPSVALYGGYTYNRFDLETRNHDALDEGFAAGLRLSAANPLMAFDPYLRFGAIYHRFAFTRETVEDPNSDYSLGLEVGFGAGIPLGSNLWFTPQIMYTHYEPQYGDEGLGTNFQHIRADVGLRVRL